MINPMLHKDPPHSQKKNLIPSFQCSSDLETPRKYSNFVGDTIKDVGTYEPFLYHTGHISRNFRIRNGHPRKNRGPPTIPRPHAKFCIGSIGKSCYKNTLSISQSQE
jgi:hypothetical protein